MTSIVDRDIAWSEGAWTNPPAAVEVDGPSMTVHARAGSDAWRHTSYGFVRDSEHALLTDLRVDRSMELSYLPMLSAQFDQAGLFVRADPAHWVKTGLELVDGVPQLGAVVTSEQSDWSTAPVPGWRGRLITVRVSRSADSLTIRARVDTDQWQLVRLCPFGPGDASAGPYVAAPTQDGFSARFDSWSSGPADAALHAPQG